LAQINTSVGIPEVYMHIKSRSPACDGHKIQHIIPRAQYRGLEPNSDGNRLQSSGGEELVSTYLQFILTPNSGENRLQSTWAGVNLFVIYTDTL
jgi:hypothetical protein